MSFKHLFLLFLGARNKTLAFDINSLTEEEKEIEAQKLMCMIDRLNELHIIKPVKVGEDGKLTEINPSAANKDDSDSDELRISTNRITNHEECPYFG